MKLTTIATMTIELLNAYLKLIITTTVNIGLPTLQNSFDDPLATDYRNVIFQMISEYSRVFGQSQFVITNES